MDILNTKIDSTQRELRFTSQNVGLYAYDGTESQWRRLTCDSDGKLNIEATLELDSSGLAKEATLTDGTQLARCMGSEDPTNPSATQRQIHLDGSGNILVKEVGTVNVAPANDSNSAVTDAPANSTAVGLKARQDKALASSETFLVCDAQGHLQVDLLNQNVEAQLAAFTNINDVSSVKRLLCDSDGHLQVDIVSGGGGGSTPANQYNNGGTEEALSVIKPTAPATGQVTPAVTILDLQNYKGVAFNVTTTSASFGDLTLGVEFSNASDFSTTLGAGYADIQIFGAKVDIGGQPITGQYMASILMIPEFNGQQPLARYARATFNHSNNAGSNISVVINSTQIPH